MTDSMAFQILRWLSPLEPHVRHRIVRANRIDGIGDWVLRMKEFREWSDGDHCSTRGVLFCCGEPGVGKTYLSSLILDHLGDQGRGKDVAIASLYYDFMARKEQSPTNMLGAILKQVIDRRYILEYANHGFPQRALGLQDLARMLRKALALRQRVFICIDGLDECPAEHRALLLESLQEIRYLQGVRILFTGRRNIRDEIEEYLGDMDIMPVDPSADDLMKFARAKLDKDTKHHAINNHLKEDIMRNIPGKVSDIFLVISLIMDLILAEPTILGRRNRLKEMTVARSLSEAYAATLGHVGARGGRKAGVGIKTLVWVSHSERLLRTDELCDALGMRTSRKGLAVYSVPSIQRLLECSLGLITVEDQSSTVRLVHPSLQEYLRQHPNVFMEPHSTMARACLEYLSFRCGNSNLSPTAIVRMPAFADYASCYWGIHAVEGNIEEVKPLAFGLLSRYASHISARLLLMGSDYWPCYAPLVDPFKGFSALHCVAFFGIAALIVALRKKKRGNVNGRDAFGATPLLWSARIGSLEGVKTLLEWTGVDPNLADSQGHTPLSAATINGHDEIVRLLLTLDDVCPTGVSGGFCWVPLVLAASEGRGEIVEALLARPDVNPNQFDPFLGRVPLPIAAEKGHEGVVRLLLARWDVNPNGLEKDSGQTPLSLAAASGHQGVVELLLPRGDISPGMAQEAFKQAVKHGHEGIVHLLLAREDVDPNVGDISGRAPLAWAAEKGHEGVVRLLLSWGDVNPNGPRKDYRQAPLFLAAMRGRRGVVELLLTRGEQNPEIFRKALKQAAENGRTGTVNLLLTRGDVDPNAGDISGRTPLSWAAQRGHERTVALLLDQGTVDPSLADLSGRTPLSWAAGNAQKKIVELILSRAGVLPYLVREWSRLIIQRASSEGYDTR